MAGALSPADVGHGPEARHRRSAHRARLRQGGADAQAARPALRAHRLRHPRRRPDHLEQLEGLAAARALSPDAPRAGRRAGGAQPRTPRLRGQEAQPARGAVGLGPPRTSSAETARHYPPYWQGLHVTAHKVFAGCCAIGDDEIASTSPRRGPRRHPRLFRAGRSPGIFRGWRRAGAGGGQRRRCAHLHHQGRLRHGRLLDPGRRRQPLRGRAPAAPARDDRARPCGRGGGRRRDPERATRSRNASAPSACPPHITFDNEGSEIYTIIEVDTRDRPGLLFDLDPHAGQCQCLHRLRGHRDLWRTGRRHLLRQGHVRAERPVQELPPSGAIPCPSPENASPPDAIGSPTITPRP